MSKHLAQLKALLEEALKLIVKIGKSVMPGACAGHPVTRAASLHSRSSSEDVDHPLPRTMPGHRRLRNKLMTEIRVPTLGESVTEATIGRWFKKAGDAVAVDEPLVELETDKVTIEVPAPSAGTLGEIVAKDGETVAVGALLGQISEGGSKRRRRPRVAEASSQGCAEIRPGRARETQCRDGRSPLRRPRRRRRQRPPNRAPNPRRLHRKNHRRPMRRWRRRCARCPRKVASMLRPYPAPARTAASPRAT